MSGKSKKKKVKDPKRKLTAAQKKARKEAKAERQKENQWVFMSGKQVRVKREPTIDGIPEDEWLSKNADPVWLAQNKMWEYIDPSYFDPPSGTSPTELSVLRVRNGMTTRLTLVPEDVVDVNKNCCQISPTWSLRVYS